MGCFVFDSIFYFYLCSSHKHQIHWGGWVINWMRLISDFCAWLCWLVLGALDWIDGNRGTCFTMVIGKYLSFFFFFSICLCFLFLLSFTFLNSFSVIASIPFLSYFLPLLFLFSPFLPHLPSILPFSAFFSLYLVVWLGLCCVPLTERKLTLSNPLQPL